ncbi:unnamed protein product [Parajaminaea phylloscopi]
MSEATEGAHAASSHPVKKRKTEKGAATDPRDDAPQPAVQQPALQPAEAASSLKSLSPDSLRISLESLRKATNVKPLELLEQNIGPSDSRLEFARSFLADHKGRDRLFEAWERIHDMQIPSLLPMPLAVLANLIELTTSHYIDNELASSLVQPTIPASSATRSGDGQPFWSRLHSYLVNPVAQGYSKGTRDSPLLFASFRLLGALVRFEKGRFARIIVENVPWNAKSIIKTAALKPGGSSAKGKTPNRSASAAATFSKPDLRLVLWNLVLLILHPSKRSQTRSPEDSVDSGALTSTKMLLLSKEYALGILSSMLNNLKNDNAENILVILGTFGDAVIRDPKYPRGALISLVKTAGFLELVLALAANCPQDEEAVLSVLSDLCTQPGRGICFRDRGWYGRPSHGDPAGALQPSGQVADNVDPEDSLESETTPSRGIYNPLLSYFIQSQAFSPLYNTHHRELLLAMLTAAPELQPVFTNSTRTSFGGGRLEPAPTGNPSISSGARLSGLLANHLMGQILDLKLPTFDAEKPPSPAAIISAILPSTLSRHALTKGLRHTDRLVRTSTIDLLARLLGRIRRMLKVCARLGAREPSWLHAGAILLKEVNKSIPDQASFASSLDESLAAASSSPANDGEPRSSKPDWILLEGTLRLTLLHLEIQRHRFVNESGSVAQQVPSFDVRKLLSASYLHAVGTGDEAEFLAPIVQLHTLRIIRLARPSIVAPSPREASLLEQLIELAMSTHICKEVRSEAERIIIQAFVPQTDMTSTAAATTTSVILEGDHEEFEAWLAALPTDASPEARSERVTVAQLLEECISRCSKNVYRYLERARLAVKTDSRTGDAPIGLPVSPLFVTFMEQVQIKVTKGLFAEQSSRTAVLRYLRRLMPLLLARSRPSAAEGLQALHKQLQDSLSLVPRCISEGEEQIIQGVMQVVPATCTNSDACKSTPDSSAGLSQLPSTFASLILVDPLALRAETIVPSGMRLLHLYRCIQMRTPDEALDIDHKLSASDIVSEHPALDKLSLRVSGRILTYCAGKSAQPIKLVAKIVSHIVSHSKPEVLDRFFFSLDDLFDCIVDRRVLDVLVGILVPHLSLLGDARLPGFKAWVRKAVQVHGFCRATELLIPCMNPDTLSGLAVVAFDRLHTSSNSAEVTERLCALRQICQLQSALKVQSFGVPELQALLESTHWSNQPEVLAEMVACATELLLQIGSDSLRQHSPQLQGDIYNSMSKLGKRDLTWLALDTPGGDAFYASLLRRFPDLASALTRGLSDLKHDMPLHLEKLPLTMRCWLEIEFVRGTQALRSAIPAEVASALSSSLPPLLFSPVAQVSRSAGDCLEMLLVLCNNSGEKETALDRSRLLQGIKASIPSKSGDAFQIGAIRLVTSIVANQGLLIGHSTIVSELAQIMVDHSLTWLVRRFAEDEDDSQDLLDCIDVAAALFYHSTRSGTAKLKAHLAEPVIEALIKRRLSQERQATLLLSILACTDLNRAATPRLLAMLFAQTQFDGLMVSASKTRQRPTHEDKRQATTSRLTLTTVIHTLASKEPEEALGSYTTRALASVYSGTLALSDRLIFDLFAQADQGASRDSFGNVISVWSGDQSHRSSDARLPLEALLSLDSGRALNTITEFARDRTSNHIALGEPKSDDHEALSNAYDPAWVLYLLSAALRQSQRISSLQWLAIVRTNALGVAVCCLSSKDAQTRSLALGVIARAYANIERADVQEKEHLLLGLDAVKNSVRQGDDGTPDALPLTTTMFLAHHLRLVGTPSSALYPVFTRFLLQRPQFDTTDVPMLYAMLQSTDAENWRLHRLWLLRFLRDSLKAGGATLEWRAMKRRYVWELLASMYTEMRRALGSPSATEARPTSAGLRSSHMASMQQDSNSAAGQTILLIQETMLSAVSHPKIAMELLCRKNLLSWISQQMIIEGAPGLARGQLDDTRQVRHGDSEAVHAAVRGDPCFWLDLLRTSLRSITDYHRLTRATAGTWHAGALNILGLLATGGIMSQNGITKDGSTKSIGDFIDVISIVIEHSPISANTPSANDVAETSALATAQRTLDLLSQLTSVLESQAADGDDDCTSRDNAGLVALAARIVEQLLALDAEGAHKASVFERAVALILSRETAADQSSIAWIRKESIGMSLV